MGYEKNRALRALIEYEKSGLTCVPIEILQMIEKAADPGSGPHSIQDLLPWFCVSVVENLLRNGKQGASNA